MSRPHQPRFWILLIAAIVATGTWKFFPGTAPDRAAFALVVGGFINPPLFISGAGTHSVPWKLGSMSATAKPDKRQAPVIVSLGDDLEGYFQTSPPAPIDVAVIFSNFHRLGARKAATAAVFAWETPDPIGLVALERALSAFDSLVMAAPLSRAVVSSPLPASFRRASLPLTAVEGDYTGLPVVNRIPLPGVILGGENSLAGFSVLESESVTSAPPLLARWGDRVVFAFSLLTVLQRSNFAIDEIEIHLGQYIKLSPTGPIVPLDESGRLEMPIKALAPYKEISAEALIDGGDDLFPKTAPDPVILRDDQSNSEPATQAFSKNLSAMVAAMASNQAYSQTDEYPRLSAEWEISLLGVTLLALFLILRFVDFGHHAGLLLLTSLILIGQWLGVGVATIWLPAIPALASILSVFCICAIFTTAQHETAPITMAGPPSPTPPLQASELPSLKAPQQKKPRVPRAKKATNQDIPAKQTTAKKTAVKKATSPRKPKIKKPPTEP